MTTGNDADPLDAGQQRELELKVARRKLAAIAFPIAMILIAVPLTILLSPEAALLSVFAASSIVGVALSVWIVSLSCPACSNPLLWNEPSLRPLKWLSHDRCTHCGFTWLGQRT